MVVAPEVVAIAVALAATLFEPAADRALSPPPGARAWRWEGWDPETGG